MMVKGRVKYIFPSILAALAASLAGLSGCQENTFVAPEYVEPNVPPMEVTIDQLYAEYMVDEAAADAKYKGERLSFSEVEVEEVFGREYTDRHGDITFVNEYIRTGPVKFRLLDFSVLQQIKVGYVLNIVGECYGLSGGFVRIDDCWVESIVGDIGKDEEFILY